MFRPLPRVRVPHVPGVTPPGSRVASILSGLNSVHFSPTPYQPIADVEGYIRSAKMSEEEANRFRSVQIAPQENNLVETEPRKRVRTFWDTKPKPPPVDYVVPNDPLTIFTSITVQSSGRVRVKISVPMEIVYVAKEKVPLPVHIKAAKSFGYPDKVLEYMIEVDDWYKKHAKQIDEEFESTYRKQLDAKPSKPKLKNLRKLAIRVSIDRENIKKRAKAENPDAMEDDVDPVPEITKVDFEEAIKFVRHPRL
jgi:hypothetical protein